MNKNPNYKDNLISNKYTHEQMVEHGKQLAQKGLITKQRKKEEQQTLRDLYKSICNSKAVKHLTPDSVVEYAKEHNMQLTNKTALAIVQYLKAIGGDNESYKIVTQAIGEDYEQVIKDNQITTLDAQVFLTEVSRILSKWITDKDLLHAIVVDIQHIKLT